MLNFVVIAKTRQYCRVFTITIKVTARQYIAEFFTITMKVTENMESNAGRTKQPKIFANIGQMYFLLISHYKMLLSKFSTEKQAIQRKKEVLKLIYFSE